MVASILKSRCSSIEFGAGQRRIELTLAKAVLVPSDRWAFLVFVLMVFIGCIVLRSLATFVLIRNALKAPIAQEPKITFFKQVSVSKGGTKYHKKHCFHNDGDKQKVTMLPCCKDCFRE